MTKTVKAYAEFNENPKMETLYCITKDGDVMRTERSFSQSLVIENEKWEKVDKLPSEAKFIGNYPISLY